jgi:hypothetical protein
MPLSFPVTHEAAGARDDRPDWRAELRRYEQAQADGTAPEASFGDLLDVINPLQHIPVVSTIYREITGDSIEGAARIVGGGLYGGVGGFVGGLVNAIVEEATGQDLGAHAMAAVGLDADDPGAGETPAQPVQRAEAGNAGPAAAPAPAGPAPAAGDAAGDSPTGTAAQAAAGAPTAAGEARPAGSDAALAGGGALTGLAALKAFARDTGQAAAPAPADRPEAARGRGDVQAHQQANAAPERPARAAGAPSSFMPLGDRGALINHRARTDPSALAAESDPLGHRRLQGDPRAVPTATPAAPAGQTTAPAPQPAPDGQSGPAGPGAAAAQGDLADRMMRALSKYEAMRRAD